MSTTTDDFETGSDAVAAAADAAMAVARAKGYSLPETEDAKNMYHLGFAEGALWAMANIEEIANRLGGDTPA